MTVVQRWTIGTAEDCDVRVNDEYVSGKHCEVALTDRGYVVRDLGSTNGTYILSTVMDLVGESKTARTKVYGWTPIREGQTLMVGRSSIPFGDGPSFDPEAEIAAERRRLGL